jgi:hypothetical protein
MPKMIWANFSFFMPSSFKALTMMVVEDSQHGAQEDGIHALPAEVEADLVADPDHQQDLGRAAMKAVAPTLAKRRLNSSPARTAGRSPQL